jgi:hypothetical protein
VRRRGENRERTERTENRERTERTEKGSKREMGRVREGEREREERRRDTDSCYAADFFWADGGDGTGQNWLGKCLSDGGSGGTACHKMIV